MAAQPSRLVHAVQRRAERNRCLLGGEPWPKEDADIFGKLRRTEILGDEIARGAPGDVNQAAHAALLATSENVARVLGGETRDGAAIARAHSQFVRAARRDLS